MTNADGPSFDDFVTQLIDLESKRISGDVSEGEALVGLSALLQSILHAGLRTENRDERKKLQALATRIGEVIQFLGLPCPSTVLAPFAETEVGCNGLIIQSVLETPLSCIAEDLRRALGVSLTVASLQQGALERCFARFDFVIAVIDKLDSQGVEMLSRTWEMVEETVRVKKLYIDEKCLSGLKPVGINLSRSISLFTDEQNLRSKLQSCLLSIIEDMARSQVNRSAIRIPDPPTPYFAHPYGFPGVPVGRRDVLNRLNSIFLQKTGIALLLAIGGGGKTCVAREWLRRITRLDHGFDGILWWSFYEADASYERLLAHASAYLLKRPVDDVNALTRIERERILFDFCKHSRLLLVLDGLERELACYSDASYDQTMESVVPGDALVSERRCGDVWLSRFLQNASTTDGLSLLITSRVAPAELDNCERKIAIELQGLESIDGEILWRSVQPENRSSVLRSAVDALGGHPLAIRVLAAAIAESPDAGGSLERWLELNAYKFTDVFARVAQRTTHVLRYALRGLGGIERSILEYISCCYSRITVGLVYEILSDCGDSISLNDLRRSVTILHSRGLLGLVEVDGETTLHLHPVVAGSVRDGLSRQRIEQVTRGLRERFRARITADSDAPMIVVSDDMLNLLHADMQLRDFGDAAELLKAGLADLLVHRCSNQRRTVDVLFPVLAAHELVDGPHREQLTFILNVFGISCRFLGDLFRSTKAFEAMQRICEAEENIPGLRVAYYNSSSTSRAAGRLRMMFSQLQASIELSTGEDSFASTFDLAKAVSLLGRAYYLIGRLDDAISAFDHAQSLFRNLQSQEGHPSCYCFRESPRHFSGVVSAYKADVFVQLGNAEQVRALATEAIESAKQNNYVVDFVRGNRLRASADILESKWDIAISTITESLEYAVRHDRTEEEMSLHVLLGRAFIGSGRSDEAISSLADPLSSPLLDSMVVVACEVFLVAAEAYLQAGCEDLAVDYAKKAIEKSICDGMPFYVAHVYRGAMKILERLGADVEFHVSESNAKVPSFGSLVH
jgi:tetratricopeptide (TPR) repeat protein